MLIAFIWVVIAQIQMKTSWRIGIDNHMKTELVTTWIISIFKKSGVFGNDLEFIGFFFTFPTVTAFFLLITGNILMQIQIRLKKNIY
jgi:hypothetical protein